MSSCVGAREGGRLEVEGHDVPRHHGVGRHVQLLGEVGPEGALVDRSEAPDRREVPLPVEHEALVVDVAVEVDRELRDAQHRPVVEEVGLGEPAGAVEHDASGEPEVAVEPRVEQGAAVDLDAELSVALAAGVGSGLEPEAGAVGVGAHDRKPAAGEPPTLLHASSAPPTTT